MKALNYDFFQDQKACHMCANYFNAKLFDANSTSLHENTENALSIDMQHANIGSYFQISYLVDLALEWPSYRLSRWVTL